MKSSFPLSLEIKKTVWFKSSYSLQTKNLAKKGIVTPERKYVSQIETRNFKYHFCLLLIWWNSLWESRPRRMLYSNPGPCRWLTLLHLNAFLRNRTKLDNHWTMTLSTFPEAVITAQLAEKYKHPLLFYFLKHCGYYK